MTAWIARIIEALKANQLQAIFVGRGVAAIMGEPMRSIDLRVPDSPTHRAHLQDVATTLGCVLVPPVNGPSGSGLSITARSTELVGGPCPIDVKFVTVEAYRDLRARAAYVGEALVVKHEGQRSWE